MAVIHRGIQPEFIGMRYAKAVGILWTQVDITLLESIFIQLEFKGIQVLVGRAVYPAAVGKTQLALWILVESNGSTWEEVGIISFKRGIILHIPGAAVL